MHSVHHSRSLTRSWIAFFLLISAILWFCLGNLVCYGSAQASEPWQKVNQDDFGDKNTDTVWCQAIYNNQLYAGTGSDARVMRYDSGDSWSQVNTSRFGANDSKAVLSLKVFNGLLYAAVTNVNTGAEVWAYDGSSWAQVNQGGFGDKYNYACEALEVFNNELYALLAIPGGFQVYRYFGSGTTWTKVDNGDWDPPGNGYCAISWNGYLWIGTENTSTGAEVWTYDGNSWTQANQEGFGRGPNIYDVRSFAIYDNHLYCCGSGQRGALVLRYDGGTSWSQVNPDGFDGSSPAAFSLAVYENKLFAGTFRNFDYGCQVWSYNGSTWTKENKNGFADGRNHTAQSMIVFNDRLYVGTVNSKIGAQVWKGTGEPPPTYPSDFYFAEGYTGREFQEYLCIGNSNDSPATAELTFMFNGGGTQDASYSVPANSRITVNVNQVVGADREVSIRVRSVTPNLVAERPMYFNYQGKWTGGSDVVGATAPSKSWYFAEGTTRPEFEEFITVQNPGSTTANLTFHYMIEGQGEAVFNGQVGPNSRTTFKASDQVGLGKDISLFLESDQPVVAERPIYFSYQGLASHNWTGGHCVVGASALAKEWYLAEGTTRDGFEEWLCLQNPHSSPITINASYMLGPDQGGPVNASYTVPAKQRLTVSINRELGPDNDVSVKLSCDLDFLAERPMYFLYHGAWDGGHDVMGALAPNQDWFFAEGYTGSNFEEWLCIENPGTTVTTFSVIFYSKPGNEVGGSWIMDGNSRLTIDVNQNAGTGKEIFAKIQSSQPIIVERPMYFNYDGQWTGGHDVVGYVPQPQ